MNINIKSPKGETVAVLEIEGGTATPREMEAHYTHFAKLFLRHLGRNLRAEIERL